MVWGEGSYFEDMGVIDYAGGLVVHVTVGIAALMAAILIGTRRGYTEHIRTPHNMIMTLTGNPPRNALGWLGFNGGSALPQTVRPLWLLW